MNGHLFGAGDPGAALAREQRRREAARRNAARAGHDTDQAAEADREQGTDR